MTDRRPSGRDDTSGDGSTDDAVEHAGVRHRLRNHRTLGPIYRVVVLIVGLAVIAAGIAMLVFPGPGWAVIILGLVILAPDFKWAERTLAPVKRFADAAAERALDPRHRRQNLILLVITGSLAAVAVVLYLLRYGLTLEPFPFF